VRSSCALASGVAINVESAIKIYPAAEAPDPREKMGR
jgi:hypothetical protein